MTQYLIFNSQNFSEILLGTHLAKLIKDKDEKAHIAFAIKKDFEDQEEILEVLLLQESIDSVGFLHDNQYIMLKGEKPEIYFDDVYIQSEWFGNLGMPLSMLIDYYASEGEKRTFDELRKIETILNVDSEKLLSNNITIALASKIAWESKLGFYPSQVYKYLSELKDVNIIELDRTNYCSYLKILQTINNCHLYIGPIGSLSHAAASLQVDTISICNVFPKEYNMPEFYHSGFHKSIGAPKDLHCGTYNCITTKDYLHSNQIKNWGSPPTLWSPWAQICQYTLNGKSCVGNTQEEDIVKTISQWFNYYSENTKIQKLKKGKA